MKDTISLTVPMDYNALTRASDMLHGLALDCKSGGESVTIDKDKEKEAGDILEENGITSPAPASVVESDGEQTAADAFGGDNVEKSETTATASDVNTDQTNVTTAPLGVDLDNDGFPWDVRIHSSGKTKLAKTKQWKKIRGVDQALVTTVEAELRAAMAAPTPVETNDVAQVTHSAEPAPAPATTVDTTKPAPAPVNTGGIKTFPDFMTAITAAMTAETLTGDQVKAALNKHGLASTPLLSSRPDLIPAVVAELGL